MASTPTGADCSIVELALKTTAPRTPSHLLKRARLSLDDTRLRDRQIVLVQAPAGYGKTSLLAQWRRECLGYGMAVAWLSADERDDAGRLLLGLVHAVRAGCTRPTFGRFLLEGTMPSMGELDGMTAWLAEIARLPMEVALIIEEAERLPPGGLDNLAYLLHNAPRNLRVVIGARRGLDAAFADLLTHGEGALIGPDMLRFRLDETIELGARFGARADADACARLVELTDGWPLGLQLAFAAMLRATDPRQVVETMAAKGSGLRDHLLGALLANLSPEDDAFLTAISLLDALHPDLCRAVTGDAGAPESLARLMRETPVFTAAESGEWCRLHTLVRDALRARVALLPEAQRVLLHSRATAWLIERGMLEEAARHAHAAGQHETAYDLAERCLHDAVKEGNLAAVLGWLDLIPESELERRPRLRLAAAWVLALGERHREAESKIERMLAGPEAADIGLRYECTLILSAAAYYADEIDRFVALFEPWAELPPPSSASWLAQSHANRLAARAILLGEPAQARRFEQLVPRGEVGKRVGYLVRWADHIVGLSYLYEGQIHLAEDVLLPALASAEADLGRRHPLSCMFAAMCASLAYESDRIDQAAALLANRLDVLERGGTPETVMLAYRTATRIAEAQGAEHRALDLLQAMSAMGVVRRLPRLLIASLAEQVRLHAGRYRAETCGALVHRMLEIVRHEGPRQGPLWRRSADFLQTLACARAAIAARNWEAALEALTGAAERAETMRLGRSRIEIMGLRALALEQAGCSGRTLLSEATNLAQTYGLSRTLADAHPALADWIRQVGEEDAQSGRVAPPPAARMVRPPGQPAPGAPRAPPSVVLTPKEREILELLARNLSNKEIALAMTVGEETVKWHLKNLFGKLDASSRRHVVRRAVVLGLLEGAS